jgi:hypothetical protein
MNLREHLTACLPVTVRDHLIKFEDVVERIGKTTHGDFSWVNALSKDITLPENVMALANYTYTCDIDFKKLGAAFSSVKPLKDIGQTSWCQTIEVRFTSFELREFVNRFGAGNLMFTVFDIEGLFEEAFGEIAARFIEPDSSGTSIIPLYFASYCADLERLADSMGSIGVDFHIPDVGLILSGLKRGDFAHIGTRDLGRESWALETLIRGRFVDMLMKNAVE